MRMIHPDDAVGRFGDWLAYYICVNGYTVTKFADMVGLHRKTVYNHIYRKSRPSYNNVKRYCEFLGQEQYVYQVYEMMLDDWQRE